MNILLTGAAGFIGFHCGLRLCQLGHRLLGIDNLTPYYDPRLKQARLEQLLRTPGFEFVHQDLGDRDAMAEMFSPGRFDAVLHLGAQAGVRYSIEAPHAYLDSNLAGTLNVLEGCRQAGISKLVYASSSSVYGANRKIPFSVADPVNEPVSLYAATKRANELMAQTYAHLYRIQCVGMRFFTVYGPWGRPDMAYYKFADAILSGKPIDVYNHGDMSRDFTYIDDIVDGVVRMVEQAPACAGDAVPHRIYNLGNHHPERLTTMIELLEEAIGRKAQMRYLPMQDGDVKDTYADITETTRDYGFMPNTDLAQGLERFAAWYLSYRKA
jgi:UDP-glucuronate 4-epimerase